MMNVEHNKTSNYNDERSIEADCSYLELITQLTVLNEAIDSVGTSCQFDLFKFSDKSTNLHNRFVHLRFI